MDIGAIFSDSFKYPFKDLKHLICVLILFVLLLVSPAGLYFHNRIVFDIGLVTSAVFLLIMPGLMILVVNSGIGQSPQIPVKLKKSIINSLKLIVLHLCYITVPTVIVFFILVYATGLTDIPGRILANLMNLNFSFQLWFDLLNALFSVIIGLLIFRWIFSIVNLASKATMALTDSLVEALKIHRVFGDIRKVGIGRFIAWYILMGVVMIILHLVAMMLSLIPYIGFIVNMCILMIIALIYYYSLGLLYSESPQELKDDDGLDFDEFEKEIQRLKYLN